MSDKEKKPIGRPTKYCPELLAKAQEYLEVWESIDVIPMIAGLATYIGITKDTISRWEAEAKEEESDKLDFSDVCARVRQLQERALINKGLSRMSDASLSKLLLMKHGYSDRQEVDHTTNGESISEFKITLVD